MYADRFVQHRRVDPVSLTAAAALCAAMIGGLVLSSPAVKKGIDTILTVEAIPIDPPPPPEPVPPRPDPRPHERTIAEAKPVDATLPLAGPDAGFVVPAGPSPGATGLGDPGPIETILPPLPPQAAPVLTDAAPDPRYAAAFQPAYPPGEQRAGNEGRVVVRVLIGADGRVKRVERVSAASDAFFAATERQALGRWRFRPATRDGVPVEAWREMTVRFELGAE